MRLAVCFVTGRAEPRLEWVLEGLARQKAPGDELAVVVVDALDGQRPVLSVGVEAARQLGKIEHLTIVSPKPNPWQGPHRLTSRDWWAMSNARNSGFCHVPAGYDFVAFLDDRCRLGADWLAEVRRAERTRDVVVCGSYEKHEDGKVAVDHRREVAPQGREGCHGGWLFGCTFALPLAWALEVNGFEEGMDGLSYEDVIFGCNLASAGKKLSFRPKMFVSQERSSGTTHSYRRTDKGVSPKDKSHAANERFCGRRRTEFTPNLATLRDRLLAGDPDPWPRPRPDLRDWYDGQLVREMT